jgi:hypothetical protein
VIYRHLLVVYTCICYTSSCVCMYNLNTYTHIHSFGHSATWYLLRTRSYEILNICTHTHNNCTVIHGIAYTGCRCIVVQHNHIQGCVIDCVLYNVITLFRAHRSYCNNNNNTNYTTMNIHTTPYVNNILQLFVPHIMLIAYCNHLYLIQRLLWCTVYCVLLCNHLFCSLQQFSSDTDICLTCALCTMKSTLERLKS